MLEDASKVFPMLKVVVVVTHDDLYYARMDATKLWLSGTHEQLSSVACLHLPANIGKGLVSITQILLSEYIGSDHIPY